MENQYHVARQYEKNKLLKSDHVNGASGELTLFCYTQECFFENESWDSITKTHRGRLYLDGIPVNCPFNKIFNLNEQPSTQEDLVLQKMQDKEYEILDKANGHLFIVSAFKDQNGEQNIVFHTKGALYGSTKHEENVLLDTDVAVFTEIVHSSNFQYLIQNYGFITLCFEAIVEHDPHTMYESQVKQYGSPNTFVLLNVCAYSDVLEDWYTFTHDMLSEISGMLHLPLIKKYEDKSGKPSDWLNDTGVEGYVIHFLDDDSRVKVKTKEYWGLRFKKDLSPDRILSMFNQSKYGKLERKLPEEVCAQIASVIDRTFSDWYFLDYVRINDIQGLVHECIHKFVSPERRKQIAVNKQLSTQQKCFLFMLVDDKDVNMTNSRQARSDFTKDCLSNPELYGVLQSNLNEIVQNM